MRKGIMILGTILIAMVLLISGSAVAQWKYVEWIDYRDVTNRDGINGPENNDPVSLGNVGPPVECGWILCDLGSGNEMSNSQHFTVFAACTVNVHNESYNVSVGESLDDMINVGTGYDTMSMVFQTPSTGGDAWRYINLTAYFSDTRADPAPGAELDAVGWTA